MLAYIHTYMCIDILTCMHACMHAYVCRVFDIAGGTGTQFTCFIGTKVQSLTQEKRLFRVFDIAGGKGEVSDHLQQLGVCSTVVDPRQQALSLLALLVQSTNSDAKEACRLTV